jgi:hypothetical protein
VKFPCNLCTNDYLTHLCPKLVKFVRLLSLPLVVLMNPFSHKHQMASSSSNAKNVASGSQNPPTQDSDHLCINIVKYEVNVATLSHDYSSPQTVSSLESPSPPKMPL